MRMNCITTGLHIAVRACCGACRALQEPVPFKKLCYGLAFFHSVIMERQKYGAVGWNIRYEWTVSDFQISVLMLKNYLEENEQLPMQILNYVTSVVNYGGRITDSNDIRIADAILSQYYSEEVGYVQFSPDFMNVPLGNEK